MYEQIRWVLSYTSGVPYLACQELKPIIDYLFRGDSSIWREDKSKEEVIAELWKCGKSEVVFRTNRGDNFMAIVEAVNQRT